MIAPLPPGTLVFNRYRVVGLAGQGEFGLTYLAQDQKRFDELCMLREFSPPQQDPTTLEQLRQYFHQAAASLYELQHPQLPHYRIMFVHGDRLYLVRDYIVGKSFGAMLKERRVEGRAFSQAEVMQLLLQTLPVLAHLHRLNMMHENLAPQSIVLRREEQIPVLIDLGLVKRLAIQLQLHPILPGTPISHIGYAAPEQEKGGEVFPGTDVYALGAIAISLFLGKEAQESAYRWIRSTPWESQITIHPDFAHVLKRMVHPNPQKRFGSANQVLRALEPLANMILQAPTEVARIPVTAGLARSPEVAISRQPGSSESHPSPELDLAIAQSVYSPSPEAHSPETRRAHPPAARKAPHPARPHSGKRRKSGPRAKADLKASAILVVSVALLVSVVSFRALSWVQGEPADKTPAPANTISSPSEPANEAATSAPASPAASPSPPMPTRESGSSEVTKSEVSNNLSERQQQAGVEMQFLSDLTDEVFYTKHPNLNGQKLTAEQTDLQADWTAIANDTLTKLEGLSPETRRKLGRYQREDYDRWTAPDSGASLNSRELNVLVNNRFAELFPDQKGKTLNPKTFGQVWYALAEEELNKLKPAN